MMPFLTRLLERWRLHLRRCQAFYVPRART
jgi:hypothetical protein